MTHMDLHDGAATRGRLPIKCLNPPSSLFSFVLTVPLLVRSLAAASTPMHRRAHGGRDAWSRVFSFRAFAPRALRFAVGKRRHWQLSGGGRGLRCSASPNALSLGALRLRIECEFQERGAHFTAKNDASPAPPGAGGSSGFAAFRRGRRFTSAAGTVRIDARSDSSGALGGRCSDSRPGAARLAPHALGSSHYWHHSGFGPEARWAPSSSTSRNLRA